MRPLGSWVVIEPVRQMQFGGILAPLGWSPNYEVGVAYTVGKVLAIGPNLFQLPSGLPGPPEFEVGDWLLVENFVGHQALAAMEDGPIRADGSRAPGKMHVVDLDCSLFGGTLGKQAAVIPLILRGYPVVTDDEEAERRIERIEQIKVFEHTRKAHLDDAPDHHRLVELAAHVRWLAEHEERRASCRRSRRMHPTFDPGRGEGVLAVLEDLDAVLGAGADPEEVAEMLDLEGERAAAGGF